jgi:hypothetical protein
VCRHDGNERGDHAGIERIVFRQHSASLGELPQFERVHLTHRHAGREQGSYDAALVSSARLKTDRRDREATQMLDQFGPTNWVVAHRRALLLRQYHDIQTILRHVDTAERERSHLRTPCLLMRARAQATVRVWKKRPELQAHSRSDDQTACGLSAATGAVS